MQSPAPSRRRPGLGLRALPVGTTMLACLMWAPPAHAHVELVGSTPAAGDVVSQDAEQVVLVFGDDLLQAVDVVVRDRTGADVVHDEPVVAGRSVEVEIDMVEPGRHDVSYRVVGLDGHPIVGSYSFTSAGPVDDDHSGRRSVSDDGISGSGALGAGARETDARGTVTSGGAADRTAADAGQVRRSAPRAVEPVLAPSAGPATSAEAAAWLPWTLAAAVLAGLLLVLRGVTSRTAVARAESPRTGPADRRSGGRRGQDPR